MKTISFLTVFFAFPCVSIPLSLAALVAGCVAIGPDEGVSLFNGRDLEGWEGATHMYVVDPSEPGVLRCDQTKIDDATRAKIIEIVGIVSTVTPAADKTFEETWLPIAKDHTAKLVDEGKITSDQATLIIGAVTVAVKGIDYVFVRYPKAKLYEGLVVSVINGFTDGFLTAFKPVNTAVVRGVDRVTYDVDAYIWLKRNCK